MPKTTLTKPPQYLLDSNFLIALLDAGDVHHGRAVQLLNKLQANEGEFFISDILINEVLSVFAKRCETKRKTICDSRQEISISHPQSTDPLPL